MQALTPSDSALGDLLVARRVLTLAQHDEIVRLAEKWHVRLGDAVLSKNWADPAIYYQTIAHHFDLRVVDLIAEPPDPSLLSAVDAGLYAHKLLIPWQRRGANIVIATAEPGPAAILYARERWGSAIEFVIASKFDIVWAVQTAFADPLSHHAVNELRDHDSEMSAHQVFTPAQIIIGYGALTSVFIGFALAPVATLIAVNLLASFFYLGNFVFKGILVSVGGARSTDEDEVLAIQARALSEDELPTYTILVPMFRESEMLPHLADSLRKLDYPLGKLDIKLVLEAEDTETIEVARKLGLEGVFEVIRVPPSLPQTKPKACNFALKFARGKFLVVYDVEDRPEPDQLRKVIAAFRRSSSATACLQCRLSYFNANENWLTRMFTLDYALWFDQMLPGLEKLNVPIPLGGTSNHFKIDVLCKLHAWDPFNVTEDADLGIRLTQKGYRVGVVDSTTFEEAICEPGSWIKQRSRWIKGYMQTFLVHTRRPLYLVRTTGLIGFLGFLFFVGGTVLSGLINPVFWALYVIWLILATSGFDPVFPPVLLFLSLFNLLAGNGALIFLQMLAPIRRGWLNLIPLSLTIAAYWVLISIAAYKALWQLLRNPFYWEKTQHGVSKQISSDFLPAHEVAT